MERSGPRPMVASLWLGGIILVLALGGLVVQRNWPKVLRVSVAGVTYGLIVMAMLRAAGRWDGPDEGVPFWPFALAGAVAGFLSGVVRPQWDARLVLASITGAALPLAGVHWLAVRTWSRVRRAIAP